MRNSGRSMLKKNYTAFVFLHLIILLFLPTFSTISLADPLATDAKIFIEIKEIKFENAPKGDEMVIFLLDGYNPPNVFSMGGERPRVVCDFSNARLGSNIKRVIKVNGKMIQKIRIWPHRKPKSKVRVVLDLIANQDYEVQQVFFKDVNIFTLIIRKISNKNGAGDTKIEREYFISVSVEKFPTSQRNLML